MIHATLPNSPCLADRKMDPHGGTGNVYRREGAGNSILI